MGSERQHYGAIDGLRTIAAIGIVMMHVKANNEYGITGFLYERVIPSFTHFTLLFMVVSAFGMCNGYYGKIMENKIPLSLFYKKRFLKILPFFALLVLMDIAISPSAEALYEAFADVTLLFGFLPGAGNIEVIGVGWFLGVIFVFYICFPFFCCLIETRRWAWTAFAVSLIYNFVCINHFKVGSSNILYSSCYFLAGGLIYLYRNEIAAWGGKKGMHRLLILAAVAASVILFYAIGGSRPWDGITATYLLVSATMLVYAVIVSKDAGASGGVRKSLLENRLAHLFSGVSMEVYLSHRAVFRAIEKTGLNTRFGNGWIQYGITVVMTLIGAVLFSVSVKYFFAQVGKKLEKA
nr:acyltransferase [uncultured Acetatifactor sp.]